MSSSSSSYSSESHTDDDAPRAAKLSISSGSSSHQHKKRLEPRVNDTLANGQKVSEVMAGIGNLYGCIEIRENVQGLHRQIVPVLGNLDRACDYAHSQKLVDGIEKLVEHYATLGKFCEKMYEKMELSDTSWLDFPSAEHIRTAVAKEN